MTCEHLASRVLETRRLDGRIYRRRRCTACDAIYVTEEIATPDLRMPAELHAHVRAKTRAQQRARAEEVPQVGMRADWSALGSAWIGRN